MKEKIHIGKLIENKMKENGRKNRWLADKLPCHISNIYRIYEQEFPDTERVIQICVLLEIDLFAHYSEYVHRLIQNKKNEA